MARSLGDEVNDVSQLVFLKIGQRVFNGEPSAIIEQHLGSIIRNVTIDVLRKRIRRRFLQDDFLDETPGRVETPPNELVEVIATLPREEAEVATAILIDNRSFSEAARRLGMHRTRVSRIMLRAAHRLLRAMGLEKISE